MRRSPTPLRARHRRFLLGLAIGFVASLGAATAVSLGYFFDFQAKALGAYFWWRGQTRAPEIVLVAVDDAAFQRLNERQPLPRRYLAAVVRGLRKSGARLIVLDMDLRRPTVPADDRALAAAIRGVPADPAGPVVAARTLSTKRTQDGEIRYRLTPLYDATLEAASGFAEVAKDDDGFFRRIPLAVPLEHGGVAGSLALVALARLGGLDRETLARQLAGPEPIELLLPTWDEPRGDMRGPSPLRFSRDDDWKINFIGPAGSFLTIGSEAVYALGASKQPAAEDNPFRNRIVLIGASFTASRDAFPTPRGVMHGVEIHANILHTLLSRTQIQPFAWGPSLSLQFLLCIAISWLFAVTGPNRALGVSLVIAVLILVGANFWGAARGAYWYDFLTPILAIRLSSQVDDMVERRRIRRSFHHHVGQEVADRIYGDDPSLSGRCRTATVMFVTLRDFVSLSETLPPERLAERLNEYFSLIAQTVARQRGLLIDIIGDGAMATYGVPADSATHALDAVRTALQLQAEMDVLNAQSEARGLPTSGIGIGIHTGTVFAGNIGSANRKKYTVVGDAVTVASLVERLNRDLQTTLLITNDTYAAVQEHVAAVDCGAMKLDGRKQTMTVYEVLSFADADHAL
ncbi:MAG: adenylate/guanylate cyclase with Chase sensor [candidate division NC10 bacterium]|nr:adenylate/guanylate cyclase with Chase sensor [candidate division NC10 bacterium]